MEIIIIIVGLIGSIASILSYMGHQGHIPQIFKSKQTKKKLEDKIITIEEKPIKTTSSLVENDLTKINKKSELISYVMENDLEIVNEKSEKCHNNVHKEIEEYKWKDLLTTVLIKTIPKELNYLDLLSPEKQIYFIDELFNNESFKKLVNQRKYSLDLNYLRYSLMKDFGVMTEDDKKRLRESRKAISIALPTNMLAVSSMFYHMKKRNGYNIELMQKFQHGIQIVEEIRSRRIKKIPDICVVSSLAKIIIVF